MSFMCHINGEWTKVCYPDELCKTVKDSLDYYHNEMLKQKERGDRTMAEAEQHVRDYRDEELNKYEQRMRRTYIEFNSIEEKTSYLKFKEKHEKCSNYLPMIQVWGCGIGIGYKVKCAGCGEEEDITDVGAW